MSSCAVFDHALFQKATALEAKSAKQRKRRDAEREARGDDPDGAKLLARQIEQRKHNVRRQIAHAKARNGGVTHTYIYKNGCA